MSYHTVQEERARTTAKKYETRKRRKREDEHANIPTPVTTRNGLETKRFQRVEEDFVCSHCGTPVKGSGFTNHCPNCLWSKHVDVNPGDRASDCGGMMEPVGITMAGDIKIIIYKCTKCNASKRNKASKDDNVDALIQLSNPGRPSR